MTKLNNIVGTLLFILVLTMGFPTQTMAQQEAVLRVIVYSETDGNPLVGANVLLYKKGEQFNNKFRYGGSTNSYGLVEFRDIMPGQYQLKVSFVGFKTYEEGVTLKENDIRIIEVTLPQKVGMLEELRVEAERNQTVGQVGLIEISPEDIARAVTPVLGGDLVSYLQTLPGVVMAGDRGGELFVRGGTPNQNLVLVNNLPIIKPFHISNIYSAFPGETIQSVDFYAGGFGAEYLGATSAVIDVKLRSGNMKEYSTDVGMGTQLLSFKVEGPIKENKSSFILNGRKSIIDYNLIGRKEPLDFYDITALYTFRPEDFTCNITGIRTFDRGKLNNDLNIKLSWANTVIGLNCYGYSGTFNYPVEFSLGFTNYENNENSPERDIRSSRMSKIHFKVKTKLSVLDHTIQYGYGFSFNIYETRLADRFTRIKSFTERQPVFNAFISTQLNAGDYLTVEPGMGTQATLQRITFEPRLRVLFQPDGTEKYGISFAVGKYNQTYTGISDTRDAGTVFTVLKPLKYSQPLSSAIHWLMGYNMQISNSLELNLEGYVIERKNIPVSKWTPIAKIEIVTGEADGLSYGFNVRTVYENNPFYLALSYGYAKTKYEAATGNLGAWINGEIFSYFPPHDRRHKINVVSSYTFKDFTFNINWEYGSGKPYTRIYAFDLDINYRPVFQKNLVLHWPGTAKTLYDRPYGGRLSPYHRLDISVKHSFQFSSNVNLDAVIGVMNVYNRSNIFYFDSDLLERINQTAILPFLSMKLRLN